jgi:hypothetical protein
MYLLEEKKKTKNRKKRGEQNKRVIRIDEKLINYTLNV